MNDIRHRLRSYIGIDRSQPSTWRGLIWFIASAGITAIPSHHMVWFLPLCFAIIGLFGFIIKDNPRSFKE